MNPLHAARNSISSSPSADCQPSIAASFTLRHPAAGFVLAVATAWSACGSVTPAAEPNKAKPAPTKPPTTRPAPAKAEKQPTVEDLRTRKSGDDWASFLGPTGDSKSAETGIVTDWSQGGPKLVWHVPLGTSYGAPAVSRGRLFHFDRYDDTARLTCRRAETGEELWKFEYATAYEDMYGYNNGPRCSPVVDEERVYIFGAEGMLHCLNVADGEIIWKLDTAEDFGVIQNFFGVGSAPCVEGDLLIVLIGGSPAEDKKISPGQLDRVSGNGSGIVAFDKRTGAVRYKITDELASYSSPTVATINGRRLGLAFARGGLVAFDPAAGKVDFQYPWRATVLESVNASNPVIVDDLVFISETYGPGSSLLRVRPGDYDVVWSDKDKRREKSMQTHWNTPVHHEGYLYGSSGRHETNAELRCIKLLTGEVMWSEPGLTRSSVLYVDGHFVCLTEQGALILLKATPEKFDALGAVVLRDPDKPAAAGKATPLLRRPAWAAPILSQGLLYVRGDGHLACLELIPERKE